MDAWDRVRDNLVGTSVELGTLQVLTTLQPSGVVFMRADGSPLEKATRYHYGFAWLKRRGELYVEFSKLRYSSMVSLWKPADAKFVLLADRIERVRKARSRRLPYYPVSRAVQVLAEDGGTAMVRCYRHIERPKLYTYACVDGRCVKLRARDERLALVSDREQRLSIAKRVVDEANGIASFGHLADMLEECDDGE